MFVGWQNAGELTLTVPSLSTKKMGAMDYAHNAFYLGESDFQDPDMPSPGLIRQGVGLLANIINEPLNMKDFVAVKLGDVNYNSDGSGTSAPFYFFIPKFRHLQGNDMESMAKPRRFVSGNLNAGDGGLGIVERPWEVYNTLPVVEIPAGANQVATDYLQTPFWADYFTRKFEVEWVMEPFATLHQYNNAAGNATRYLTFAYPDGDDTFNTQVRRLVDHIQRLVVTDRRVLPLAGAGVFNPSNIIEVLFVLGGHLEQSMVHGNRIVRLNLDLLNSWIAGGVELNHADALTYGETVALWTIGIPGLGIPPRSVQMEDGNWEENSYGLMRNEDDQKDAENEIQQDVEGLVAQQDAIRGQQQLIVDAQQAIIDGGAAGGALAAAILARDNAIVLRIAAENERGRLHRLSTKSFYWRSVFNLAAPVAANVTQFPALNTAFWNADIAGDHTRLFLPRKRDEFNQPFGITEEHVTCVEPFFGYSSGTNQLRCDYPLDTGRLGRSFPGVIQDYTYTLNRDYSKLFKEGFIQDPSCQVEVIPTSELTFVTIRERDGFRQDDKSVSKIGEATHTINTYTSTYVEGDTPVIKIETRQGQFEYVFLHCDFKRSTENVMPTSQPIVTAIKYKVYGRDNQFVRTLDQFDLERISRENCNDLADWRGFQESGRGILLHLADLGLTEEVPFPKRGRMKLEFTLLTTKLPSVETFGHYTTETVVSPTSTHTRTFTVNLIRHNRLLKGDMHDLRFTYLNEE
jgi:hypothetical protein